jgi:hypothetical protein
VQEGALRFAPTLLHRDEFVLEASKFRYVNSACERQTVSLPPDSIAFTFCQTPIIYTQGKTEQIEIVVENGRSQIKLGNLLDKATTRHILDRDGHIQLVRVTMKNLPA